MGGLGGAWGGVGSGGGGAVGSGIFRLKFRSIVDLLSQHETFFLMSSRILSTTFCT